MRISDWSSDVCSSDLHGFARKFGHAFGGGARCKAAGGEDDDLAVAPRAAEHRGCDSGRLARARRGDQDGVRRSVKRRDQIGKGGFDRKRGQYARATANSAVSIIAARAADGAKLPSASIDRWP